MSNPNNCKTCEHKDDREGGWCYMFRAMPTEVCGYHTGQTMFDSVTEFFDLLITFAPDDDEKRG